MASAEITYADIDRLLTSLGFFCEVRTTERKIPSDPPKEHVVYRHEKEGTIHALFASDEKFLLDEPSHRRQYAHTIYKSVGFTTTS